MLQSGFMRHLIGLLLVLQPNWGITQNRPHLPSCPTISVKCPEEVEQGSMMVCSAFVSGFDDLSGLKFRWTVSTGVIKKGKNSNSVVIDPTEGFPGTLSATVEVDGLPSRSCPKTASSSSGLYVREYSSTMIVEYGDITFDVEQNYLDLLAQRLRDEPGTRPWIIAYAGRVAYEKEALERADHAKQYLVEKHGIEPLRIVVVDGGFREVRSVELWLEESGALNDPLATPTLKREEVQIQKRKPNPR